MRIALVRTLVPFAPADPDGAALVERLLDLGHDVEEVRLPFRWDADPVAQVLGIRLLELPGADHVVALGFPASAIRHPRLIAWRCAEGLPAAASEAVRGAHAAVLKDAAHVVPEAGSAGVEAVIRALA